MFTEDQPGRSEPDDRWLHAALARMTWAAAPTVRLNYHRDDDTLIVELVEADPVVEVLAADHLLVEFDGDDPAALPTTVYLTGLAAAPDSLAVALAREVLGADVWAAVSALVAAGYSRTDLCLEAADAAALRTAWGGLAERLRHRARVARARSQNEARVIGVELVPGEVRAVLTDGATVVLGEVAVELTSNDPHSVVEGIADAVRELVARHPSRLARRCPVGVQLGGPVTTSGVVEFYDKPLHVDDESWKAVPLGDLLRSRLDRRVLVVNDAAALAAYEVEVGFGPEQPSFAILFVGQGIGAKLVRHGLVESFPMEIGIFAPVPGSSLREAPMRRALSVERKSGVRAIVEAVDRLVEERVDTLEKAATAAGRSDEALQVFSDAGRRLARAMANIQAVVDPQAWAVYGPPALLDTSTAAGRIFLGGLRTVGEHLDYNGLHNAVIVPRPLTRWLGARAAAAAVLRSATTVSAGGTPLTVRRETAGGRRSQES